MESTRQGLGSSGNSGGVNVCPVCGTALTLMDEQARASHVNRCLDSLAGAEPVSAASAQTTDAAGGTLAAFSCMICGVDLTSRSLEARQEHVNQCCDAIKMRAGSSPISRADAPLAAAAVATAAVKPAYGVPLAPARQAVLPGARWAGAAKENAQPAQDLRGATYSCVACGKDLTRCAFQARVNHVKKCGASKGKSGAANSTQPAPKAPASSQGSQPPDPGSPLLATLQAWLDGMDLGKYGPVLERAGVGLEAMPDVTDSALVAMGVVALGARRKLLAAASRLPARQAHTPGGTECHANGTSRPDDQCTPGQREGRPPATSANGADNGLPQQPAPMKRAADSSKSGISFTKAARIGAGKGSGAAELTKRGPANHSLPSVPTIDAAMLHGKDCRGKERALLECLYPSVEGGTSARQAAVDGTEAPHLRTPPFAEDSQVSGRGRCAASQPAAPLWRLASAKSLEQHGGWAAFGKLAGAPTTHAGPQRPRGLETQPGSSSAIARMTGSTADTHAVVVSSPQPVAVPPEELTSDRRNTVDSDGDDVILIPDSQDTQEMEIAAVRQRSEGSARGLRGAVACDGQPAGSGSRCERPSAEHAKVEAPHDCAGGPSRAESSAQHIRNLREELEAAERHVACLRQRLVEAERGLCEEPSHHV